MATTLINSDDSRYCVGSELLADGGVTQLLTDDPLWYKDAIIYELHVRTFYDSDGDGVGDFFGLTQRLDYLQDLGVTALWLLPFCPSPLKDDGYDYTAPPTSTHGFCGPVRPSPGITGARSTCVV